MSGSWSSPAARFSRRFMPPLYFATRSFDAIGQADELEGAGDRAVERGAAQAVERAEEPEVGARRELVVERARSWGTRPMRRFFGSVSPDRRAPSTRTSPCSGVISPAIIDTVVVLPAPFGPSRPTSCPRSTENETPSTATSVPHDLRRSLMSSM